MKICQRHGRNGPLLDPYCVDCWKDSEARIQADAEGHAAGMAGKNMDTNPHGETDELHWIWLRAWVSAGLEKHCPANDPSLLP